jgi:hypothetical protein
VPVKRKTGTYMILKEVYKRVCAYHSTNEKTIKEGHHILVG